ncbi:hypothetical protein N7517_010885, partial [Penicillium concentricum]
MLTTRRTGLHITKYLIRVQIIIATNTTYPVCRCRDPNAWKGQLTAGMCSLGGLVLVLGTVMWVIWFNAQQARLRNPQSVKTEEYLLERKEGRKKNQRPWWKLWAKKAKKLSPPCANKSKAEQDAVKSSQAGEAEEKQNLSPRLTKFPLAVLPSWGDVPHVQRTDSGSRLEFIALRGGLRLLHQPEDVDSDVLSDIREVLRGKGT